MLFLREIDRKLAIPELLGLMATINYCLVPALMFDFNVQAIVHPKTFGYDILAVPPSTYYRFAFTTVIIFNLVLTVPFRKIRSKQYIIGVFNKILDRYNTKKIIILFIGIYIISTLMLGRFGPLNYVFSLGTKLMPLILILALFMRSNKESNIISGVIIGIMALKTVQTAMFGQFFFLMVFYILFYVLKNGLSTKLKIIMPILGIVIIMMLQIFKMTYRSYAWEGDGEQASVRLAIDVAKEITQRSQVDLINSAIAMTLLRLNQAYLTSRTLEYIPEKEPFANGQTIIAAISTLIPRIIWLNKPELSGSELMRKYGNYNPYGNVSMSIGQLGEAYVNFGIIGGSLFFALYGYLIIYLLYRIIKFSKNGKPLILFIPIIFYHMIKVEVIFSKSFNTAFKGIVFSLFVLVLVSVFCSRRKNSATYVY